MCAYGDTSMTKTKISEYYKKDRLLKRVLLNEDFPLIVKKVFFR
jgi:hypothetical protein